MKIDEKLSASGGEALLTRGSVPGPRWSSAQTPVRLALHALAMVRSIPSPFGKSWICPCNQSWLTDG